MRKAITMLIVFAMGVSLWADNGIARPSKSETTEIRFPDHIQIDNNRDQEYSLYMVDSYGDGWNGASVDLFINGSLVLDDATVADGEDESLVSFDVDDFDYIHTEWTEGAWDGECAYAIYNSDGDIVAGAGTDENPALTLTHTVDFSGVNIFANSGFEGVNSEGGPAEWGLYPGYNFSVETTGNGVYNSDDTFTAFDGDKSFKMWSAGWEGSENNVYYEWVGEDVPPVGTTFDLHAYFYSHVDDFIGQASGEGQLVAKYFGFGPNGDGSNWWEDMLLMDTSDPFGAGTATASTWEERSLTSTIPEGTYLLQLGFMLVQTGAENGGSVYVDNLVASVQQDDEPDCDLTELHVQMQDSYGDGWNGNTLTIGDEVLGLEAGLGDTVAICLDNGSYAVTCGGGSWASEVSWQIVDLEGTVLLEGGAPYEGVLTLGDSEDVFGCMDESAINYDPDATFDDGSCYYAGDSCSIALDFVDEGGALDGSSSVYSTLEPLGAVWYTMTLDQGYQNLTVSLLGSGFDTQLEVYSDCATMIAENDDYDLENEVYQSQLTLFDVAAGTYYCRINGYESEAGSYVLTVNAFQDPTNPTGLTALGGLERVYTAWNPAQPAAAAASFNGDVEDHIQWQYDNKKQENLNPITVQGTTRDMLYERMEFNLTRDTEVIITLFDSFGDGHYGGDSDGDAYVVDADGNVLDTLAGPWEGTENAYGPWTLPDGVYSVEWDPTAPWLSEQTMQVTDADGNVLGEGAAPSACFALGEGNACGFADLTVTGVEYDNWTGRATAHISNIGILDAGYFYTMAFIQEPDTTELYPPGYFQYAWDGDGLAAGEEMTHYLDAYLTLPGLTGGYDGEEYTLYVMADGYGNYVFEGNEGNNVASMTVDNTSPLANTSWNLCRQSADETEYSLCSNVTDPSWQPGFVIEYTDDDVTAETEYCYVVTQVDGTSESVPSNEACATPSAPPDVPEPTNLMGSSSGFNVTLTWDTPEPYEGASFSLLGTPSSTRQGGDTVEDATPVTELPASLEGTVVGYTDDYDCNDIGTSTSADVVYSITPDMDMAVNMTTCFSSYDTKLFVFENEVGNFAVTTDGEEACNDDGETGEGCTAWTSRIDGLAMSAGNTYYVVVDGWSGSEGDYILDIEGYNPLAGFTIWNTDGDAPTPVGQAGPDDTEWNTVLFAAEPTDLNLAITATYLIPGIFDPVVSDVVGPVTVTVQLEDNPNNLGGMDYGNDVHLMWDPPIDASSMELAYDDGVVANAWYYAGAVATRFRVQGSYGINGLANAVWTGGWPDAFLGETPFTLSVLAVDPETDLPGDTLVQHEVLVDADPTSETYGWAMVEFEETLEVDGDVFVMYSDFGYDFENNAAGPDMDMMGCDAVLDFPGNKYNWNVAVAGEWTLDVDYGALNCGDWILHMMADFTVGGGNASFGDNGTWIDPSGAPSTSNLPPSFARMEAASTKENPVQLMTPPVSDPTWASESIDRDMLHYNVYRDDVPVATVEPGVHEYMDMDLEWGTYMYHITAQYDNHESIPTNQVEVVLSNVAPDAVMLISPGDGAEFGASNEDDLEEEVAFIWTAANDADNDPVSYILHSWGLINGDTVYVHIDSVDGEPLTATGLFVPHGALAEAALEAGVPELTWNWDVWSTDGFEITPSMSGVRTMHIDVADMLGIDVASLPTVFALHNNYPNPFNPITNINYDIPEVSEVTLEIYNVMGQRVRTLVQGTHEPGRYQIVWNATNDLGQGLSSGMYVYRIQAGDFVSVKKLVLMK